MLKFTGPKPATVKTKVADLYEIKMKRNFQPL
jgi:hypothetical protein